MLHPVAVTGELDHLASVQFSIQQRSRRHLILEGFSFGPVSVMLDL